MNQAQDAVTIAAHDETIPHFSYPGNSRMGDCFLRIRIHNNTPVILCVQRPGSSGTSVTNAVEDIFLQVFKHLWNSRKFSVAIHKRFIEYFAAERYARRVKSTAWEYFSEKTVWIEHYPAGVGLAPEGSYAIVGAPSQNPFWNYVTIENAARIAGVDVDFLTVEFPDEQYARQGQ